jgi:hypothetical protein
MILSEVDKYPIVVIAEPRSGSSVICRQIGFDLDIPSFNDITYAPNSDEITKFLNFIKTTNKYVMKFHPHDMHKYPKFLLDKINNNESYNIKVIRKNKIEHIASVYISEVRNKYTYDNLNPDDHHDPVKVEVKRILGCIQRTAKNKMDLETLDVKFDKVVIYEDYIYDDGTCAETPKPSNYSQILSYIEVLLKDKK